MSGAFLTRQCALKAWLRDKLQLISQKSKLAEAIRYALSRWQGLNLFLDNGRIEIDNNIVKRAIRPLALTRKNALFAGSELAGLDERGDHRPVLGLGVNAVELYHYLADVITRIVEGHPRAASTTCCLGPTAYLPTSRPWPEDDAYEAA